MACLSNPSEIYPNSLPSTQALVGCVDAILQHVTWCSALVMWICNWSTVKAIGAGLKLRYKKYFKIKYIHFLANLFLCSDRQEKVCTILKLKDRR